MKVPSAAGLVLGAFVALLSPDILGKLSSRETYWLLMGVLVFVGLGEVLLPAIARLRYPPTKTARPDTESHEGDSGE